MDFKTVPERPLTAFSRHDIRYVLTGGDGAAATLWL